MQFNWKYWC